MPVWTLPVSVHAYFHIYHVINILIMPKFLVHNSMQGVTSTLLYLTFHLLEEVHWRSLQLHISLQLMTLSLN